MRSVQDERLPPGGLAAEEVGQALPPPLREAAGRVDRLAILLVEVDVEVLGLEHPELERLVLNLVCAEVLCRRRLRHQRQQRRGDDEKQATEWFSLPRGHPKYTVPDSRSGRLCGSGTAGLTNGSDDARARA